MTHTFRTSRPGSALDPSTPHIILVGLPGSGKSTVGLAVAERLGRAFLDFDVEIERREGRSVAEIFAEKGEPYFRKLERRLTEELAVTGNMIVAPGGGWAADPEVVAMVRPPAKLIYLKVWPAIAIARLGSQSASRPLLSRADPKAELIKLLDARRAAYTSADHVIETDPLPLEGVIEKVTELASARL
jgi:shikimate kinase